MELVFLLLLIVIMVVTLASGFPVAFALPGSAILTIAAAALCGYLFAGDVEAYFSQGGPIQWLNAGVTNFRGIYWEAERDTLIAIPLFIFMGIMLERSKIAEDLLVTMAQLFGPIPGGLGISVVFVGALLAATTGIVGATVVAMGLISLPVMMRNNYAHSLATGTIAASGTLGQIIPPSIVLIILADQLATATDQGATIRLAEYKEATGKFSLPSEFGLTSTSAGDMFLGALLPGLVLVGLYILYILVLALFRPRMAPPIPFEGKYDLKFLLRVIVVLVPPLGLIFAVLGSIVLGVATVNQAGALGAIGALVMAGYRLREGKRDAFYPAMLTLGAVAGMVVVLGFFDINVKLIKDQEDVIGLVLASIAVIAFFVGLIWSGWRAYKIDDTLRGVMMETAKTTSLVFIILLGAAMLTAAFRAFGGEILVKDFLTGLPGGFITKFVVVMAVIFVLGFFLDFIEIAVVVVPIIAPILLADTSANITAVWLGVMIGVNMQTSFLTPPFGFALFYLRGVAPAEVRTIDMYRGVVPFILLQLGGLAIVGFYPSLVNYLPNSVYLTSQNAPPPKNPRLQACLEEYLFQQYDTRAGALRARIDAAKGLNMGSLPKRHRDTLTESISKAGATFDLVAKIRAADAATNEYLPTYEPMFRRMQDIRPQVGKIDKELVEIDRDLNRAVEEEDVHRLQRRAAELKEMKKALNDSIPAQWAPTRKRYAGLLDTEIKARRLYRRTVDDAYEPVAELRKIMASAEALAELEGRLTALADIVVNETPEKATEAIKAVTRDLRKVSDTSGIASKLSRARRALRGNNPKPEKAAKEIAEALRRYHTELGWRRDASAKLEPDLKAYDDAIKDTIGLRSQERLSSEQAGIVASCMSIHRDISLKF